MNTRNYPALITKKQIFKGIKRGCQYRGRERIKEIIKEREKCMIPRRWTGINGDVNGLLPLDVKTEDLPKSLGCRNVFLNPVTEDHVKKEIERLTSYMYIPSTSRYASPINPVDKKEPPYVRVAIDYRQVNKYIISHNSCNQALCVSKGH